MVGQGIFKTNETWMKLQFLSKTTRFLNRYFPVFVHLIETRVQRSENMKWNIFPLCKISFFVKMNIYGYSLFIEKRSIISVTIGNLATGAI